MTLGPELVDHAELYCPEPQEGAFVHTDADGRRVPNRLRALAFSFGFFKDIKVPYYFSIILPILDCLFCGILWFSAYVRSRRDSVVFVPGWLPLFTYIIFRQAVHLLRMNFDMERVMALFDRDRYFSYDICFLFTILIYSVLVHEIPFPCVSDVEICLAHICEIH